MRRTSRVIINLGDRWHHRIGRSRFERSGVKCGRSDLGSVPRLEQQYRRVIDGVGGHLEFGQPPSIARMSHPCGCNEQKVALAVPMAGAGASDCRKLCDRYLCDHFRQSPQAPCFVESVR